MNRPQVQQRCCAVSDKLIAVRWWVVKDWSSELGSCFGSNYSAWLSTLIPTSYIFIKDNIGASDLWKEWWSGKEIEARLKSCHVSVCLYRANTLSLVQVRICTCASYVTLTVLKRALNITMHFKTAANPHELIMTHRTLGGFVEYMDRETVLISTVCGPEASLSDMVISL